MQTITWGTQMKLHTNKHSVVTHEVKPQQGHILFISILPVPEDIIGQYECIGFTVSGTAWFDKLVVFKEKKIKTVNLKKRLVALASRIGNTNIFLELARTQEKVIIFNPLASSIPVKTVGEQGVGIYVHVAPLTGELLHTYLYTNPPKDAILPISTFNLCGVVGKPKGVPIPTMYNNTFLVQSNGRSTWCVVPIHSHVSRSRIQTAHLAKVKPHLFTVFLVDGLFSDIPSHFKIEYNRLDQLRPTGNELFYITEKQVKYQLRLVTITANAEFIFKSVRGDFITSLENEIRFRGLRTTTMCEIQLLQEHDGTYRLYNTKTKTAIKNSDDALEYLLVLGFFS